MTRRDQSEEEKEAWRREREEREKRQLDELRNEHGELTPPWARFPDYSLRTIGWRMGIGELWQTLFFTFLRELDPSYEVRLSYLRRYPPAPINQADRVYHILHGNASKKLDLAIIAERQKELLALGLIQHDVAYSTWLAKQSRPYWPWRQRPRLTPQDAVRIRTREMWFWSRWLVEQRNHTFALPELPEDWQVLEQPLRDQQITHPAIDQPYLWMAQMMAAGRVLAPWEALPESSPPTELGECAESYPTLFASWCVRCFDDKKTLHAMLAETSPSSDWQAWFDERCVLFSLYF